MQRQDEVSQVEKHRDITLVRSLLFYCCFGSMTGAIAAFLLSSLWAISYG
jgi:hypothetical protein